MLKLTRRIGESLVIEPSPDLHPDMTVRELFKAGPVVVTIRGQRGKQTRIGVDAPDWLSVIRSELRQG